MPRILPVTPDAATGAAATPLATTRRTFHRVPRMPAAAAQSSAAVNIFANHLNDLAQAEVDVPMVTLDTRGTAA